MMRKVCQERCPVVGECRAELFEELAAGRYVVGMRAGLTARQRSLQGLVPVAVSARD